MLTAQNLRFQQITAEAGLSNSRVPDIIQDRAGFIWIATADGLSRYDGYSIKVYRNNPGDTTSISDNRIRVLYEGRDGYIWIGTESGFLNRYDPDNDTFRSWQVPSDLVRDNSIITVYEDRHGWIWIGTYRSGLYRFTPATGRFEVWRNDPANPGSLSHNYVMSIREDDQGTLLVSTFAGFNRMINGPDGVVFESYFHEPGNPGSISHNTIWALTPSERYPGRVWISTGYGLTAYEHSPVRFTRYPVANPEGILFGESVGYVAEDSEDGDTILWMSSYGGLVRMNARTGDVTRYMADANRTGFLSSNQINKVYRDRSGVLWIATENGLNYLSSKSMRFNTLPGRYRVHGLDQLLSANVTAMAPVAGGGHLLGTSNGLFRVHPHETGEPGGTVKRVSGLDGLTIWALARCPSGETWIGTYGSGLFSLDKATGRHIRVGLNHPALRAQSVDFIRSLWCDPDGTLWIGFWGLGLARYDPPSGSLLVYQHRDGDVSDTRQTGLSHNDVWAIMRDGAGRLWVGTGGGGLNLMVDEQEGTFVNWTVDESPMGRIGGNVVFTIWEQTAYPGARNHDPAVDSARTTIWVGTNGGLNRIDIAGGQPAGPLPESITIKAYTASHGLADLSVKAILPGTGGNLWVSTNSGVSIFDADTEQFRNYSAGDGIARGNFNQNAAFRSADGIYYFGNQSGLVFFAEDRITRSGFHPPVKITGLSILNEPVEPGTGGLPGNPFHLARELKLTHNQNLLSFEFAALDFNAPELIRYAYRLDPFDQDWVESGNRRFITYTNLKPGRYTFRVRATNADGIWGENEAMLSMQILPPWWQTNGAYLLYFILFVSAVMLTRRNINNRMRIRNELKQQRFEAEKRQELEQMKSRLFANLSHEFRTPIQLMKGPLELMLSETPRGRESERYRMMYRNTLRLQTLVDQMLELSRLEEARVLVKAARINLMVPLRGLVYSFESLAAEKQIRLEFNSASEEVWCWVDTDKLEKVVNNLLSNAFKFSSAGSAIRVRIVNASREGREYAELSVSDEGTGIPEPDLGRIFERFYQVDDPLGRNYGGSGIGLALVKELVDLHRWRISVDSRVNMGTTFTVAIPLWDDYLGEDEKITGLVGSEAEQIVPSGAPYDESGFAAGEDAFADREDDPADASFTESGEKPAILLVEDSADLRSHIRDFAGSLYRIIEAENGAEGLKKAFEEVPDLIISDVMMPEMDGFDLCRRLKSEMVTSHIPVILLTARGSEKSRIEGLETGADDYLAKPFNARELMVRVRNLLEQRRKLRELYSKHLMPDPMDGETPAPDAVSDTKDGSRETAQAGQLSTLDQEFFKRVMTITEKHIGDSSFDTEALARELFMSRMQLHRKMIAVTGQTAGDYMRGIRLKRAGMLLREQHLSVTQVAYEVGYSSASQFTRAFARQFGKTPSEYMTGKPADKA